MFGCGLSPVTAANTVVSLAGIPTPTKINTENPGVSLESWEEATREYINYQHGNQCHFRIVNIIVKYFLWDSMPQPVKL